jgi:hypothetical protein
MPRELACSELANGSDQHGAGGQPCCAHERAARAFGEHESRAGGKRDLGTGDRRAVRVMRLVRKC